MIVINISWYISPRCPSSSISAFFKEERRSAFVSRMESATLGALQEARERSWRLLEHDARPCQEQCQRRVLRQGVETLWDSGLLSLGNSDALALTALQGAVAACLPKLPEQAAAELAGEALVRFQHPSEEASTTVAAAWP